MRIELGRWRAALRACTHGGVGASAQPALWARAITQSLINTTSINSVSSSRSWSPAFAPPCVLRVEPAGPADAVGEGLDEEGVGDLGLDLG